MDVKVAWHKYDRYCTLCKIKQDIPLYRKTYEWFNYKIFISKTFERVGTKDVLNPKVCTCRSNSIIHNALFIFRTTKCKMLITALFCPFTRAESGSVLFDLKRQQPPDKSSLFVRGLCSYWKSTFDWTYNWFLQREEGRVTSKCLLIKTLFFSLNSLCSHLMVCEGVSKGQGLENFFNPQGSTATNTGVTNITKGYISRDDTTAASLLPVLLTDVASRSQQLHPHILLTCSSKKEKRKAVDRRELRAWAGLRQDSLKLFLLGGT